VFRAVNFRYITIEWMKPRTFGDAAIAAYKVYVNGIVEASLSAEQFSFSYTKGVACREYVFQVQVLRRLSHCFFLIFMLVFTPSSTLSGSD